MFVKSTIIALFLTQLVLAAPFDPSTNALRMHQRDLGTSSKAVCEQLSPNPPESSQLLQFLVTAAQGGMDKDIYTLSGDECTILNRVVAGDYGNLQVQACVGVPKTLVQGKDIIAALENIRTGCSDTGNPVRVTGWAEINAKDQPELKVRIRVVAA